MVGIFLLVMLAAEVGMCVYNFVKKTPAHRERSILRLAEAAAICTFYLLAPKGTTFQWVALFLMGAVLLVTGIVGFIRSRNDGKEGAEVKPFRAGGAIARTVFKSLAWVMVLIPLFIFPPYKEPETSGEFTAASKVYTWVDESRVETLDDSGEKRHVTVTFYYPAEKSDSEKCPLIIFSHGAFGFEKSNYSSYNELVSNGYVVASVSHTYHAFFTEEADGTTKIVNSQFIQEAVDATNGIYSNKQEQYELTKKWMDVRLGDANFVLDSIIASCNSKEDPFFGRIDLEHIGYYGHSMGGATAVEMGRQREEIDAVVVLDGTFIGAYTGVENDSYTFIEDPYTKPILEMRARNHSDDTQMLEGERDYVNVYTMNHALNGKVTVIDGTAHMNLTDLPLFSPTLAKMLGTGDRDSREAIEITNECVREWFDAYVKGDGSVTPHIKAEY